MRATPTNATLPQLLARYRAASTGLKDGKLNESIPLTDHSTGIEGSSLNLAQTRNLIQNGKLTPDKPLTDQYRMIDHHQALEQVLTVASQRELLNRIALQDVAATLMRQTGGPTYSLLSHFDTSQGGCRIDSAMVAPWSAGGCRGGS